MKKSRFIFSTTITPEGTSAKFFENILKLHENISMSQNLKSKILCLVGYAFYIMGGFTHPKIGWYRYRVTLSYIFLYSCDNSYEN